MTASRSNGSPEPAITSFRDEYGFLSNFAYLPNGTTVEHLYQAEKTTDPRWREMISQARTPAQAKALGSQCPKRPDWDKVKVAVMRRLLKKKFTRTSAYGRMLLATGDRLIVEGNLWHDMFWGQCNCDRHKGNGRNELGKLLMEIRSKLRKRT